MSGGISGCGPCRGKLWLAVGAATRSERRTMVFGLSLGATIGLAVAAVVVLFLLIVLVSLIPDIRRYFRLRSM
jgi:hypothetical protein